MAYSKLKIILLSILCLIASSRSIFYLFKNQDNKFIAHYTLSPYLINISPLPIAFDHPGFFNVSKLFIFDSEGRMLTFPKVSTAFLRAPISIKKIIKHGMLHPLSLTKIQQNIFRERLAEDFFCNNQLIKHNSLIVPQIEFSNTTNVYLFVYYLIDSRYEYWGYKCKKI